MYYNYKYLNIFLDLLKKNLENYKNNNPFIISIEGNDKSGKTTFINELKEFLNNIDNNIKNIKFIKFPREENVNIKKIIEKYKTLTNAENYIELYKLFHIDIYSFDYKNNIYIVDRYNLSSIVYSILRNVNLDKINKINSDFKIIEPNIIIYFNRIFNRNNNNNCEFDSELSILNQIKIYKQEINKLLKFNKYDEIYNDNNEFIIYKKNK